jgi:tetratricopeptide (TPR) repeat protein
VALAGLAAAALATAWPAASAALSVPPAVERQILEVTDRILNLDLDAAEAELSRIPEGEGGGAVVPFFRAMVAIARSEDREDPKPDWERAVSHLTVAVERADRLLDGGDESPLALTLAGMAHGALGMIEGGLKYYLTAYREIVRAQELFARALEKDPRFADAMYGVGLYEYSMASLSPLLRAMAGLILPPGGDKARGLELLRTAAEHGKFTRNQAKLTLLRILVNQENRRAEALPYAEELKARHPGNPDLYFYLALIYSETGETARALEVGREIQAHIDQGRHHFAPELLGRYYQLLGKIHLDHGDLEAAAAFFRKAIAHDTKRYAWVTAWAWTRLGMIADLRGDRRQAQAHYRTALKLQGEMLAKERAREYLREPYRGDGEPTTPNLRRRRSKGA